MKKFSAIILIITTFATLHVSTFAEIPYLSGRVNDYAQILSENTIEVLSVKLKEHEQRTTNQLVILTLPSLQGESIEDFSNKVFIDWKLGQQDQDNGILIVVVPDERRMRIEVGYGLEAYLPDVIAARIIREIMAPRFRDGDFDGGISEAVLTIIGVLEGQELPETAVDYESSDFDSGLPLSGRILLGAFVFGIIGLFTFFGIVTPGIGWFLYVFLIPFWATFPMMIIGSRGTLVLLIIYIIAFPLTKLYIRRTPWFKKAKKDLRTKGKASIGGFTFSSGGSGGSGSSWSSGSGSSGGFSGGGGSSGGGGASGGW